MNDHTEIIPEQSDNPYRLGRHVSHDPRNLEHRALVRPPQRATRPYRAWISSQVFDQGNTSSCTTQAAVGIMRTQPFNLQFAERVEFDEPSERQAFYEESKSYDPWPGSDYDGSSTDAPFRLLRERGVIESWRWLFGESEVREYLTWYGPLAVGTLWLDAMFTPDAGGYLNLSGGVAGGHAYRLVQYNPVRDAYRVVNSWGRGWGQSGRAWLRAADLTSLLSQDGEAVTIGA